MSNFFLVVIHIFLDCTVQILKLMRTILMLSWRQLGTLSKLKSLNIKMGQNSQEILIGGIINISSCCLQVDSQHNPVQCWFGNVKLFLLPWQSHLWFCKPVDQSCTFLLHGVHYQFIEGNGIKVPTIDLGGCCFVRTHVESVLMLRKLMQLKWMKVTSMEKMPKKKVQKFVSMTVITKQKEKHLEMILNKNWLNWKVML